MQISPKARMIIRWIVVVLGIANLVAFYEDKSTTNLVIGIVCISIAIVLKRKANEKKGLRMEESKITNFKKTFKKRLKTELKFRILFVALPIAVIITTALMIVNANVSEEDYTNIIQTVNAVVMVCVGIALFKIKQSNRVIKQQKELLEEKQKEILDSIEYALRIQTAILPPQKIVKQYLENSFIVYKPKDIVAGDFYWMETVNDLVLFAACDCTGHGVPGAMVSVVCHNALNRAVREFGLTEPAKILDKTAEIVIENFSKSEEDIKDGMDISLVSLKLDSSKSKVTHIEWAGANNPLWIVRKTNDTTDAELSNFKLSNFELIETKADKQPIGMNEYSKPFTNHTFTLNSGDTIYLFTDGFADQFGGETGEKKLTKKRFKELILSIQDKSMQEQGIALDKFITEYRKEVEQIDDILVMGVRV